MFWRRKKTSESSESVYDRLQRQQMVVWQGNPITVGFDYQPYLKDSSRRRVNINVLQRNEQGELSFVGYCHDAQEERTFKLSSVQGEVLVEKLGEAVLPSIFARELEAGRYDA